MKRIKTTLLPIIMVAFAAVLPTDAARWHTKPRLFGPTGIYGTLDSTAKTIKVTEVGKGSPADGKLKPGAVVIGTAGAKFKEHVRRELADAIDTAETEKAGGKLTLMLAGGGTVELKLEVLGSYSDTAPYDCPKSARILERAEIGGGILTFSQLATMAQRDAAAVPLPSAPETGKLIASRDEVETPQTIYFVWHQGYELISQCEGYLLNPNPGAFKSIRETALRFAAGQDGIGVWGHKLAVPETGRLHGYGAMNQPSLAVFIGMLLARECGVKDPLLHDAIKRTYAYFKNYVGRGGFNYGVHGPNTKAFNNNGMSGTAAIAMALHGDKEGARFFAQLSAASYDTLEQGHAAHFFNPFWTPLGAAVGGPELMAAFFKEARWFYTMARRWDGKFEYRGQNHKFDGSSLVIPYTLAERSLLITGRNADESIWLEKDAAQKAAAMGRIDYAATSTEAMIAMLDHPIPQIQRRAGWQLRERKDEILPRIRTMMKEGSKREKIFALGYISHPTDLETGRPYVEDMVAVLKDSKEDPGVRAAAANALSMMGDPARQYYMDIVKLIAEDKPSEGLYDSDYSLALTAERICKKPFADGLVPNRKVHYAVARKLMKHTCYQARVVGANMLVDMPLEDFDQIADDLLHVIEDKDNSYSKHSVGPMGSAILVLASLNIREGMAFSRQIPDKAGKARGMLNTLCAIYTAYGANAKGELKWFTDRYNGRTDWGKFNGIYKPMVKAVEEDKNPPKLISLEEARQAGALKSQQKK